MKHFFSIVMLTIISTYTMAQAIVGKIIDRATKEPLQGATIKAGSTIIFSASNGTFSLPDGIFEIEISYTGYINQKVSITNEHFLTLNLDRNINNLSEVVMSANRTAQKRTEVPVAIATISKQTMDDAKATRLDQLLNKVSGVNMVSLGNEQHGMSIRQPISTKSLFLYLEDGIPVRTTGLYNHNALLEMNMAATSQIEIIKGPASSVYGAEAIGGSVNIITQAPPAYLNGMVSMQLTNTGYKRMDLQIGDTYKKLGLLVSGYYANRRNGIIGHSDFHKSAFTIRGDYNISEKMKWVNSITYVDYYSDMLGSLDSAHFKNKDYSTSQTFTYRKVPALRMKSQLLHQWSINSMSQLSAVYRNNAVQQNPSYRIKNEAMDPSLAHGEINKNSFNSYILIAQHQQKIKFLNSKWIAGISFDGSPSKYYSNYIRIQRDGRGYYVSHKETDSVLSKYQTKIHNIASYLHYEGSLINNLKITVALRYDYYQYNFINALPSSSYTGAQSSTQNFKRFSPKIGATYNYKSVGAYANYSEGFVPPQISELFTGVKVPYLGSQTFYNYEVGGWFSLLKNKLYADWSWYLLNGTNEIITVKNPDNSTENKNAGKTKHTGIEYGINYKPIHELFLRFSAVNCKHTFIDYVEKGIVFNGKELSGGSRFIANAEISYKPSFIKGFRIGAEWQHISSYFMNNANTKKYNGYDLLNIRTGYIYKGFEIWINVINATNTYYSTYASKSASGSSYYLGDPQEFNVGFGYKFSGKQKS